MAGAAVTPGGAPITTISDHAMTVNAAEKKRLRGAAHPLKPIVMIGNRGYTAAVVAAIDEALRDHELIKVRLRGIERAARQDLIDEICRDLDAEFIALVGTVATLYRAGTDDVKSSS
jgi:RNA-binding protein